MTSYGPTPGRMAPSSEILPCVSIWLSAEYVLVYHTVCVVIKMGLMTQKDGSHDSFDSLPVITIWYSWLFLWQNIDYSCFIFISGFYNANFLRPTRLTTRKTFINNTQNTTGYRGPVADYDTRPRNEAGLIYSSQTHAGHGEYQYTALSDKRTNYFVRALERTLSRLCITHACVNVKPTTPAQWRCHAIGRGAQAPVLCYPPPLSWRLLKFAPSRELKKTYRLIVSGDAATIDV